MSILNPRHVCPSETVEGCMHIHAHAYALHARVFIHAYTHAGDTGPVTPPVRSPVPATTTAPHATMSFGGGGFGGGKLPATTTAPPHATMSLGGAMATTATTTVAAPPAAPPAAMHAAAAPPAAMPSDLRSVLVGFDPSVLATLLENDVSTAFILVHSYTRTHTHTYTCARPCWQRCLSST